MIGGITTEYTCLFFKTVSEDWSDHPRLQYGNLDAIAMFSWVFLVNQIGNVLIMVSRKPLFLHLVIYVSCLFISLHI